MKLYYAPGACSLSPHIVLRELGQKFDLVKVDLATKKTEKGDDFAKVNPQLRAIDRPWVDMASKAVAAAGA